MKKNRNYIRVLNYQQIKDIIDQVADDFRKYPLESAEHLMNFYLNGDTKGLYEVISDWIESAEDTVIDRLNSELIEDSFNEK